ncbi:MAG: tryptophan 2,3-dioxygenase family protein [Chloroflexi bacterium]|nr:tryptophan 2,3-dioxygenase family protein [Chloroflexota bacterium]MCI0578659.1 tryptophan 2,3-dioxygenase family protein [Chloroflexota bacterium]MCI0647232.1 tryptophan 2,3-dioxygenase family protein [Chloroflexota bacterium]MCI0728958.1 tryptophan 2,3-dioxygenase family protein [Chloroflexota bacterium]
MDREFFYDTINGKGTLDYELYLNTKALLSCQKDFSEFCNRDELMFQIVHQAQELWMKLIGYTLLDVDEFIQAQHTNRVLTLFRRVHTIQARLIDELAILETMSPKEYQEIRLQLGNGSGQESPGFRTLLKMSRPLWQSFVTHYLDEHGLTVEKIYDMEYNHDDAYMVAEALAEYDELFRRFRHRHIQLIERTIGLESKSLKGRAVALLEDGLHHRFFPELWAIRSQMTDKWGAEYGVVRDSIGH